MIVVYIENIYIYDILIHSFVLFNKIIENYLTLKGEDASNVNQDLKVHTTKRGLKL